MHELIHFFGICGEPHPSFITVAIGQAEANIYVKIFYDRLRAFIAQHRSAQQ